MRQVVRGVLLGMAMLGGLHAQAQTAMHAAHDHKPVEQSKSLTVTVDGRSQEFSAEQLADMPQHQVSAHNGHTNMDETYSGVPVSDLLAKFGVSLQGDGAKKVYQSYLRATGTDGYFVLYSAGEVEGGMHTGEVIVALTADGKPLQAEGRFKLVSTEDKRPARWVRNLQSLTLVTVPR